MGVSKRPPPEAVALELLRGWTLEEFIVAPVTLLFPFLVLLVPAVPPDQLFVYPNRAPMAPVKIRYRYFGTHTK